MRLVVVEGDDLLRSRLVKILVDRTTFEVVGEGSDAATGLALTDHLRPEVVVMGDLVGPLGLESAVRQIKANHPSVLVLCAGASARRAATRLVEAGASGFLDREHPESLLHKLFPPAASGRSPRRWI